MPASISTPVTLGTTYADDGTLGPFQEVDEIIFQFTGGPVAFQFGTVDPSGAVRFDNQEIFYPPGAWAFRNIKGIRFRSIQGQTAVSLQAAVAFFADDPEPFTPGNVPGSVSLTSTLNFQHNDIFVAAEPTIDFEDGSPIVWNITDDNANSRVKITPVFNNAADKSSASAQVFTGPVSTGPLSNAIGQTNPGTWDENSGRLLIWRTANSSPTIGTTLVGDTSWRFAVDATGTINWSPGNAVSDLQLGRVVLNTVASLATNSGAGISNGGTPNSLATTGWVVWSSVQTMSGSAAGNNVFGAGVVGDTTYRFLIQADGELKWGSGASGVDTILYRDSANSLSTDDRLRVNSNSGILTISTVNNNLIENFYLNGDTQPAFKIYAQGAMIWGPGGTTAADIELARLVNSPTGTGSFLELINGDGFGYGTGNGGAVTQATSKTTTTPACNHPTGKVTLAASTLNAGQIADFTVPCSVYGIEDTVIVTMVSIGTGISSYRIEPIADGIGPTNGNMRFSIQNIGSISEGAAVAFQYAIIKGAIS